MQPLKLVETMKCGVIRETLTISKAPLMTPHRTLLYHNPPASASSGSSTKSANGFSSKVKEKTDPGPDAAEPLLEGGTDPDLAEGGGGLCVTVGEMLRKDLKPT